MTVQEILNITTANEINVFYNNKLYSVEKSRKREDGEYESPLYVKDHGHFQVHTSARTLPAEVVGAEVEWMDVINQIFTISTK